MIWLATYRWGAATPFIPLMFIFGTWHSTVAMTDYLSVCFRASLKVWRIHALVCLLAPVFLVSSAVASNLSEPGAFPVHIEHALGVTTVTKEPERIVTLGWNSEDIAVALGKMPVGIPTKTLFASGMLPWFEEHVRSQKPYLLDAGIDFEAIALLKPDVILAVQSGLNKKDYARLSRLAPTVAYREGPWRSTWQEQTRLVGLALGQPRRAETLIAETASFLENLGTSNPDILGKTFTIGIYSVSGGNISVYLPADPRVEALASIGLQISPAIRQLAVSKPNATLAGISLELVQSVDADFLLIWSGPGGTAAIRDQPLLMDLSSMKRGTFISLDDPVLLWGSSAISVLSIPYTFPRIIEKMTQATQQTRHE